MEPVLRPRSVIGTYGPVLLIAASVAALMVGVWFFVADPITVGILWVATLPAAGAAVLTGVRHRGAAIREQRLRAGIEADRIRFEEERAAWEERLKSEQRRLEVIESHLVDQAAAVAWIPAPLDHASVDPALFKRDEKVDQLIEATTDRVYEALRESKYIRNERFEGRLFWEDVATLVRDVAAVYQPGGEKAWLETDARQLALAVHRAALRVSLRLEQLPTAPSSRKLADLVKWTETYRTTQGLLDYAKPLMNYVPWLYRLISVLAGANPATLGLSAILFTLVKQAGIHVSVDVLERIFKSLLREFLTAVGQEAANVYGGTYGRRSKAWVLGSEAVHLAREAAESRAMLAAVIRLLDTLELRDEVDRRALQRALVAPTFLPVRADWLPIEDRTAVLERIETLFEAHPSAMEPAALAKWKAGLEARLGHRSRLAVDGTTVHDEAQLDSIVRSLAMWGRRRGASPEAVKGVLRESTALTELEENERGRLVDRVVAEIGPAVDVVPLPRFDLTETRKKAFIDDLIEAMGRLRPWGPEPDFEFLYEVARRFRLDPTKLRTQLGARYTATISEHLDARSPLKKLAPGPAFAALVCLTPDEHWDFAEDGRKILSPPDATKEDKKALRDAQQELNRGAGSWLLVSELRAVLLRKPGIQDISAEGSRIVWEGRFEDRSVRVERTKAWGRSATAVFGGRWSLPPQAPPVDGLSLELSWAAGERILLGLNAQEIV